MCILHSEGLCCHMAGLLTNQGTGWHNSGSIADRLVLFITDWTSDDPFRRLITYVLTGGTNCLARTTSASEKNPAFRTCVCLLLLPCNFLPGCIMERLLFPFQWLWCHTQRQSKCRSLLSSGCLFLRGGGCHDCSRLLV